MTNFLWHLLFMILSMTLFFSCSEDEESNETPPVSVMELSLLTYQIPDEYKPSGKEGIKNLPKGAIYQETDQTIYFIPQKGQRGKYEIEIEGNETLEWELEVTAVAEETLQKKGPTESYSDGDIGYIFLHGKTMSNLCESKEGAEAYWLKADEVLAPDETNRTLICYDGTKKVSETVKSVAEQMEKASCGLYGRCIVVTHSMGGLMLEHMLIYAGKGEGLDEDLKGHEALYQKVKDKILMVISIASAAGGSKTADVALELSKDPDSLIGQFYDLEAGSNQSLRVNHATTVLAPVNQDPGVPFFMVAGYSENIKEGSGDVLGSIFDSLAGGDETEEKPFNGSTMYSTLDQMTGFTSRSDGAVAFRSSCGTTSSSADDGPKRDAEISEHLKYCYAEAKKPNHYVLFLSDLNHDLIIQDIDCKETKNRCQVLFPDEEQKTFTPSPTYTGQNTIQVIRKLIAKPTSKAESSI